MLPLCGEICCKDLDLKCVKNPLFYVLSGFFFLPLVPEREVLCRAHGWIPFKATVLQLFSQSDELCIKRNRCKMWGWNPISIKGRFACEPCRVSDLSVWITGADRVLCTWSDHRKRNETLVSMNRLTPSLLPATPLTTHLWWCIRGISCSLSEWADWIDVFSTWSFPHKKGKPLPFKQHWEVLSFPISAFFLSFFLFCSDRSYGQLL